MTTVTLASTAGFCFGVNRAADLIERLLAEGKRVATLGPLLWRMWGSNPRPPACKAGALAD